MINEHYDKKIVETIRNVGIPKYPRKNQIPKIQGTQILVHNDTKKPFACLLSLELARARLPNY